MKGNTRDKNNSKWPSLTENVSHATEIVTRYFLLSKPKLLIWSFKISLKMVVVACKDPLRSSEQVRPGSACAVRPVFPFRVSMNVDDKHEDELEL